jgi:hypothetical protein
MPYQNLAIGQSYDLGGEGVDGITVGPFHLVARVKVFAWHSGHKEGGGSSANIILYRDGSAIKQLPDSNFDTYNLQVSAEFELGSGSETSISIAISNQHAKTDSFGIRATVTGFGYP